MIAMGACRAVPLGLVVLVSWFAFALAQQSPPAKSAAPKSAPKSAAPGPKSAAPAPQPAAAGGQATLVGQFGEWGAYTAAPGGKKLCYALAKPTAQATNPPGRPRDPAYVFISTRPSENVRNEVFLVIGYPFKPGSDASADIGANKFAMQTQLDGAWVKNPAEEASMVDAMRRGSELVVTGESGRGTRSTDRYPLRGLSQALDRVAQECR